MMKNLSKLIYALIAFTLLFTGCSKDDDGSDPDPQADVYISGYTIAGKACYWSNGQVTTLSSPFGDLWHTETSDIVVAHGKVYMSGTDRHPDGGSVACYYKDHIYNNVTMRTSADHNASAHAIFVDGNDVYVAGDETRPNQYTRAKYWKNGQEVALSNGAYPAHANDIYVSAGDVHVVGHDAGKAIYWKNGQRQVLDDLETASAVFVKNNDVYIAGTKVVNNKTHAAYMKNGIVAELSERAWVSDLFVDGNDVYTSGGISTATAQQGGNAKGVYWKNQQLVDLTGDGVENNTGGIFVFNKNVYVVGRTNSQPVYWVNGNKTALTANNEAYASAIYVVDKK